MSTFARILKSAPNVLRPVLLISFSLAMAAQHASAQERFGKVHFPVACRAGVQEEFDLALAMLHTFSFPAAAKTFMAIAQKDPDCAMAHWGIAATAIGSLYGGRPGPMALQGEQAVEQAKTIGGKDARERDYIATIEAFYKGRRKTRLRGTRARLCKCPGATPSQIPRGSRGRDILRLCSVGDWAPTDQTFSYQLKGAAILEKLLCRAAGSSWRGPLSPSRLRQHAKCFTRTNSCTSVSQGSTFVAACVAISFSHLQSHGPLARIDRDESGWRGGGRSILQTARDGFPRTQLLANRPSQSCQARGR